MTDSKKKVFMDMGLNIIALAIPTFVLQILILPALAKRMPSDQYGLILTILALMNTVPASLGNVLNNVRLLHQNDGDDPPGGSLTTLLCYVELLNIAFLFLASVYYLGTYDIVGIALTVITGIVWLSKGYHIVAYRIKIDYRAILISNILAVIGYGIGYGFYILSNRWQFIYIISIIVTYIYIGNTTTILHEKPIKTQNYRLCLKDTLTLSGATVLSRIVTYADKILLYPIMGGTAVAIYNAASLLGRVVSLITTPVNSVALSYLSKYKKRPVRIFKWTLLVSTSICVITYFVAVLLSRPLLQYIYPEFAYEALKYVYITSASIAVSVLKSTISPFVLKFCDTIWQILINLVSTGVYVVVSLILVRFIGLLGFCYAVLIANVVNLLFTLIIYFIFNNKQE